MAERHGRRNAACEIPAVTAARVLYSANNPVTEAQALLPDSPAFLNVAHSVTGRRWLARSSNDRLALALSQSHALPEIVGRVLAARGVTLENCDSFLTPTIRALMPDPSRLADMDTAANRLAEAVTKGESITVYGDYDVDGATSAALLHRYLSAVGRPPRFYIPDRIAEGYGPNTAALLKLHHEGVRLVVTVDCGTTAYEPLAAAAKVGLDVVVLDHHATEGALPEAVALVNPNRFDDNSGLGTLCAAGVTFLTVVALNRTLRKAGWFRNRPEPDLMSWLDLVALGTVCDVVPLVGLNRALVTQGLKVMARRGNPGLVALGDVAGMNVPPEAYHAGFVLGPRVNAGGRVGASDLGTRLLSTDDPAEAMNVARQLDELNTERRQIEAGVLEAALEQIGNREPGNLVFLAGADWHPGVIGIAAARLMERFRRPACVLSVVDGVGKGSGRSVRGVDLGAAIIAARQSGILLTGGGHRMAAGFSVAAGRISELQEFLSGRIAEQLGGVLPEASLELDGALSIGAVTPELAKLLATLGPFGSGNAEPRFAVTDARVVRADVVGTGHVRCILTGAEGGRLKAIAFRCVDNDLGQLLLTSNGRPLHLAGPLRLDTWNGNTGVQLVLDDAAAAV
ncbi:MAG: single-stranded-DNA-specific exonuclease RecJ [Rhodospirillaceae bacterium]